MTMITRSYHLILTALFLAVFSLQANASVMQSYKKANTLFKQGKYRKATRKLEQIVQRYPQHTPSYFLLGKIYYLAGKPKRAARYYRRAREIPPGDEAYAYGISLYSARKYRLASEGFKRVPKNSRYRDYAEFYLAICLYKIRNYTGSQYYFILAKRLPQPMERTKRRYLQAIANKQNRQRYRRAPRSPHLPTPGYDPYYSNQKIILPPHLPPGEGSPYDKENKEQEETAPSVEKPEGFSASIKPTLEFRRKTISNDLHGFGRNHAFQEDRMAKVSTDLRYDTARLSSTLKLDLTYINQASDGIDIEFTFVQDDPGTITARERESKQALTTNRNPLQNFDLQTGLVDLTPGFTYKAFDSLSLGLSYNVWQRYDGMSGQTMVSANGPSLALNINYGLFTGGVSIAQEAMIDNNKVNVSNITTVSTNASFNLWGSTVFNNTVYRTIDKPEARPIKIFLAGFAEQINTKLGFKKGSEYLIGTLFGAFTQATAPAETPNLRGSHEEVGFGLDLQGIIGLGLTLNGSIRHDMINKFVENVIRVEGEADRIDIAAVGTRTTTVFGFNLVPIDWFYLNANMTFIQSSYEPVLNAENQEFVSSFQRTVPSSTVDSTWAAGVSFVF